MIVYLLDAVGNYLGKHEHKRYAPLPERFTEVAPPAGDGFAVFVNGVWQLHDAPASNEPPVTSDMVDVERDRRITAGFMFGGRLYQGRPDDRENMLGASTSALAAMMNGAQPGDLRWHGGATDFAWIAADNSRVPMDAQTMFALGQAAMAHKQAHIFAARDIKDADPIPADYADDRYWPG